MRKIILKSIIVIVGSFIMGAGVAIAVCGRQGADPLAVVWDGMSNVFTITVGQANIVLNIVLFIIAFLLDKKQLNLGTILNPIFSGISTDFVMSIITIPESLSMQILQSTLGVFIIGIGIGMYTSVNFGKSAYDALVFGVASKYGLKLFLTRMIFDALMLITGFLLGGTIGVSTIFAVLCMGKIISIVYEKSRYYELKFLYIA
ncbi:YczE/YyaS/YitT family protein [Tyzzerella sp. An114]|uniref:YczE/YyaS/YitT family protein n=1 Tax=Tyzzerella sp. An114 TaxID=1965545 RepID=UPI001302A087|nr:YitT family protein [Tyzzerella sp. An114]